MNQEGQGRKEGRKENFDEVLKEAVEVVGGKDYYSTLTGAEEGPISLES